MSDIVSVLKQQFPGIVYPNTNDMGALSNVMRIGIEPKVQDDYRTAGNNPGLLRRGLDVWVDEKNLRFFDRYQARATGMLNEFGGPYQSSYAKLKALDINRHVREYLETPSEESLKALRFYGYSSNSEVANLVTSALINISVIREDKRAVDMLVEIAQSSKNSQGALSAFQALIGLASIADRDGNPNPSERHVKDALSLIRLDSRIMDLFNDRERLLVLLELMKYGNFKAIEKAMEHMKELASSWDRAKVLHFLGAIYGGIAVLAGKTADYVRQFQSSELDEEKRQRLLNYLALVPVRLPQGNSLTRAESEEMKTLLDFFIRTTPETVEDDGDGVEFCIHMRELLDRSILQPRAQKPPLSQPSTDASYTVLVDHVLSSLRGSSFSSFVRPLLFLKSFLGQHEGKLPRGSMDESGILVFRALEFILMKFARFDNLDVFLSLLVLAQSVYNAIHDNSRVLPMVDPGLKIGENGNIPHDLKTQAKPIYVEYKRRGETAENALPALSEEEIDALLRAIPPDDDVEIKLLDDTTVVTYPANLTVWVEFLETSEDERLLAKIVQLLKNVAWRRDEANDVLNEPKKQARTILLSIMRDRDAPKLLQQLISTTQPQLSRMPAFERAALLAGHLDLRRDPQEFDKIMKAGGKRALEAFLYLRRGFGINKLAHKASDVKEVLKRYGSQFGYLALLGFMFGASRNVHAQEPVVEVASASTEIAKRPFQPEERVLVEPVPFQTNTVIAPVSISPFIVSADDPAEDLSVVPTVEEASVWDKAFEPVVAAPPLEDFSQQNSSQTWAGPLLGAGVMGSFVSAVGAFSPAGFVGNMPALSL